MKKKLLLTLGMCLSLGIQRPAKAHINLTPYTLLYTRCVATYFAANIVIAGAYTTASSFCHFLSNTDKPTDPLYRISFTAGLITMISGLLLLSLSSTVLLD